MDIYSVYLLGIGQAYVLAVGLTLKEMCIYFGKQTFIFCIRRNFHFPYVMLVTVFLGRSLIIFNI